MCKRRAFPSLLASLITAGKRFDIIMNLANQKIFIKKGNEFGDAWNKKHFSNFTAQ